MLAGWSGVVHEMFIKEGSGECSNVQRRKRQLVPSLIIALPTCLVPLFVLFALERDKFS